MREPKQEAILAAYIAASGKHYPLDAARDAAQLCGLARSLRRLYEAACNSASISESSQRRACSFAPDAAATSSITRCSGCSCKD